MDPLPGRKGKEGKKLLPPYKLVMVVNGKAIAELPMIGNDFQLSLVLKRLKAEHHEAVRTAKAPPQFVLMASSNGNDSTSFNAETHNS